MTSRRIPRRTLLKVAAGAMAVPLIGSPYVAHAADPLVINTYGGDFEKFMRSTIVPEFEKQTGIKTKLDVGLANAWIATCRAAGPENPPYDVLMVNAIWAQLLRTEGFFEKIPVSGVPNAADLYPAARIDDDNSLVGWYQPMGVAYMPDAVSAPIKSWKELWTNPALSGKLGQYTITNTAGVMFLLMMAKIYGGSEYNTDAAFNEIKKLKPFVQVDFSGTMETMLSREEIVAGPLDFAAVTRLQKKGIKIAIEIPEEGSYAFDQVFSVMKASKKKKEAYAWLNYMLSADVQAKWVKEFYVTPANSKVAIPADMKSMVPFGNDQMKSLVTFDWATANKNRDKIIERWNREMT
jgi:putative spermidine/putrescine transport system substrate-binding protein